MRRAPSLQTPGSLRPSRGVPATAAWNPNRARDPSAQAPPAKCARAARFPSPSPWRLRRHCSAEREFQGGSGRCEIGTRGPAAGTSSRGREEGADAGPRDHRGSASGCGSGFNAGKSQQRNRKQVGLLQEQRLSKEGKVMMVYRIRKIVESHNDENSTLI